MNIKHSSILGLIVCLFWASSSAYATSVRQLNLDEMLDGSELIFEGVVTKIETDSSTPVSPGSKPLIFTRVYFNINEVIKGTYRNSIIQLNFLGGSGNGKTISIDDMVFPKSGEHGVYFVERVDRKQVHPLYGWSQGHFLVATDPAGIKRVMTANQQSVTGVKSEAKKSEGKLSKGAVSDLQLESAEALSRAMRLDDFKRKLVEMQRETGR